MKDFFSLTTGLMPMSCLAFVPLTSSLLYTPFYTLQEALELFKPDFISRSQGRVRRLEQRTLKRKALRGSNPDLVQGHREERCKQKRNCTTPDPLSGRCSSIILPDTWKGRIIWEGKMLIPAYQHLMIMAAWQQTLGVEVWHPCYRQWQAISNAAFWNCLPGVSPKQSLIFYIDLVPSIISCYITSAGSKTFLKSSDWHKPSQWTASSSNKLQQHQLIWGEK